MDITEAAAWARNHRRLPEHSEAMVHWAMIGIMTRRLAPTPGRKPWQQATSTSKI